MDFTKFSCETLERICAVVRVMYRLAQADQRRVYESYFWNDLKNEIDNELNKRIQEV